MSIVFVQEMWFSIHQSYVKFTHETKIEKVNSAVTLRRHGLTSCCTHGTDPRRDMTSAIWAEAACCEEACAPCVLPRRWGNPSRSSSPAAALRASCTRGRTRWKIRSNNVVRDIRTCRRYTTWDMIKETVKFRSILQYTHSFHVQSLQLGVRAHQRRSSPPSSNKKYIYIYIYIK